MHAASPQIVASAEPGGPPSLPARPSDGRGEYRSPVQIHGAPDTTGAASLAQELR